jgi:hypothetical protein
MGVDLVRRVWLAGIGFLVDSHQSHFLHQPLNTLPVDPISLPPQVASHLPGSIARRLQELLVYQLHKRQVLL